jgi:hypothetical protein
MRKIILALILVSSCRFGHAQTTVAPLDKNYNGVSFLEFVASIEAASPIRFFFNEEWVTNLNVIHEKTAKFDQVLRQTLAQVHLDYIMLHGKYIVLVNKSVDPKSISPREVRTIKLTGRVIDSTTDKPLPDISVSVPGISNNIITNSFGRFEITIPVGHYILNAEGAGYQETSRAIRLFNDLDIEIKMFEKMIELQEVEITSSGAQLVNRMEIGVQQLTKESLQTMPRLLGEADIVRSVLSLPGVKTVGEGASGFNVRGGNVDQNLILIDNAPLFNSSHLFGLFSVINPDIVSSLSLHKGSMPPRYGGRLSSVLDIHFDEKVSRVKPTLNASIGVVSSKLSVTCPLIKDMSSLVFAARGAYPNWVLQKVPDQGVRTSKASFYDATIKVTHRFNKENLISLTSHVSNDLFRLGADTTYTWSGYASSFQWAHAFSEKLNGHFSAFYSENTNEVSSDFFKNEFALTSYIKNTGLNYDISLEPAAGHQIDVGVSSNYFRTHRGNLKPITNNSALQPITIPYEHGLESAFYISDAITFNTSVSVSAGIRLSSYLALGPGERFYYDNGLPRSELTVIANKYISRSKIEKSFFNLEPRVNAKITLTGESSMKIGVSRNFQYISLLSNSAAVSPVDTWKLSDYYLEPQQSDQLSAGYFRNLLNNTLEFSIEGYYKIFANLTQYKQGARLLLNNRIEADLLQGDGKSYGAEFYLKRNSGKLTGWLSYTYSRTFVRVKGKHEEETLSRGNYFPSNFDKPHDLSIVMNYQLSRRIGIASTFVYSTGRPISYPESIYVVDGFVVANYSELNQSRIPDYHRLDLAVNHSMLPKRNRKFEASWSLGVYNAYARRNPFSVFFRPIHSGRYPQAYRLSVLGMIIPYFSLNFKIQ